MHVQSQTRLSELLHLLHTTVRFVHIRLALTTVPRNSSNWIARSLIVDAFPKVWLDSLDDFFGDDSPSTYVPPRFLYEYPGRALFFAQFIPIDQMIGWFTHTDVCELLEFDSRPGYRSRVERFSMPEVHEEVQGTRIVSGKPDGFATLPWPRNLYQLQLMGQNGYRDGDYDTLYAMGQPHFENLREARAKLIHDVAQGNQLHQDSDAIAIRMIDADGWIHKFQVSNTRVDVMVRGLRIFPGVVILKGTGIADQEQRVMGPKKVSFGLNASPPPDLRVILANEREELDRAWRTQWPAPFDPPAAHVLDLVDTTESADTALPDVTQTEAEPAVVPDTPNPAVKSGVRSRKAQRKRVPSTKTNASADTKTAERVRILRVVIASPGDVKSERGCVQRVLTELNRGLARQLGLRLEAWMWETDAFPGFHADGPQGRIDASMDVETADIVVGIFWMRFGTPVKDAKSGTEHELRRARAAWKQSGSPHVMVYFNDKPVSPGSVQEFDQFREVRAFRDEIGHEALYWTYKGSKQFEEAFRKHLELYLRETYGNHAAGSATLLREHTAHVEGERVSYGSANVSAQVVLNHLVKHYEPEMAVTADSVSSATGLHGRELIDALGELADEGAIKPLGNVAHRFSAFTVLIAAWERVDRDVLGFDVREDMLRVAEVASERQQIDRDDLLAATSLAAQRLDIAALLLASHSVIRLYRPIVRGLTFRSAMSDHKTRQYVREHRK